jgi:2-isopropylmalate synthase
MTETDGGEVTPAAIWAAFENEYLPTPDAAWGRIQLGAYRLSSTPEGKDAIEVQAVVDGAPVELSGTGDGPIDAFFTALAAIGVDARLLDYVEHTMSQGSGAQAASYWECAVDGKVLWGVGIDTSIVLASIKAVVSAVNRAQRG